MMINNKQRGVRKMETRSYVTDVGETIYLPATDERVMTIEELMAKYSRPTKKTTVCPKCHTYCYGDCDN